MKARAAAESAGGLKHGWRRAAAVSLAAAALVVMVILTHDQFTVRFPGGNDSIPRYYGARAWLFEGLNPYSETVSVRGQIAIYGRPADDLGEDKARFAYPFFVIFFYLPLAPLSWEWARAVGIVSLEIALAVIVVFSLRTYRWRPPRWLTALTILWAILFYHGARTIVLWQFAGISAALIAVGIWAIKERRDALAGICLALAAAKPQMMFLLLPMVGLWSVTARRWKLAASLAASMAVLLGLSFLFVPTWLMDMLNQVAGYQDYTDIGSPVHTLTHVVIPGLGPAVEWGLNIVLIAWLLWEWWGVRGGDGGRFDWVLALTLVITNLVALRTATTNYVMMIPALIFLLAGLARAHGAKANIWIALVELALLIGLWALFAATVKGRVEQPPMYLPLPFGLLAGLIVYRLRRSQAVAEADAR